MSNIVNTFGKSLCWFMTKVLHQPVQFEKRTTLEVDPDSGVVFDDEKGDHHFHPGTESLVIKADNWNGTWQPASRADIEAAMKGGKKVELTCSSIPDTHPIFALGDFQFDMKTLSPVIDLMGPSRQFPTAVEQRSIVKEGNGFILMETGLTLKP